MNIVSTRIPVVLVAALLAALCFGAGQANSAPMPTVVLVHGAFADATSWDGVAADLRAEGYPVVAVDNPLRKPSYDGAVVKRVLDSIAGPVILVGHSYGGAVITNAARDAPNVRALVYVAAFAPAMGEPSQLAADPIRYPGSKLLPPVLLPTVVDDATGVAGKNVDVFINPAYFRDAFAADVPEAKIPQMLAHQRSLALVANLEPGAAPAYEVHPSWWLLPTQDNAVPPAAQRAMAARAHAQVTEIAASHAVLVSHPEAVVQLVETAAAATR